MPLRVAELMQSAWDVSSDWLTGKVGRPDTPLASGNTAYDMTTIQQARAKRQIRHYLGGEWEMTTNNDHLLSSWLTTFALRTAWLINRYRRRKKSSAVPIAALEQALKGIMIPRFSEEFGYVTHPDFVNDQNYHNDWRNINRAVSSLFNADGPIVNSTTDGFMVAGTYNARSRNKAERVKRAVTRESSTAFKQSSQTQRRLRPRASKTKKP